MRLQHLSLLITGCFVSTLNLAQAPGGVITGLETWLKANAGITGATPVTTWTNQYLSGTGITVNGSPNLNSVSTAYNYNPYIEFSAPAGSLAGGLAPNRQFLRINGFNDVNGINYTSLFFVFQLNDLSRVNTHIATVENVTYSTPANGTLHGDNIGNNASVLWEAYDIYDFGISAPVGTWQRNGNNIQSNSLHSNTKHILSANCTTGGSTTLNTFLGGQRDLSNLSFLGHYRDWKGPVGEIIGYKTSLSVIDKHKIDTYLAVKYGITLANNYISTDGTTIFAVANPYNTTIIGIGRDDAEALQQKQSHTDDDAVRIYINNLAGSNVLNPGTIVNNLSYVIAGSNSGNMCATTASNNEMPTGLANCTLFSRLEREWKITRTNFSQSFNMDFQLAPCGNPGNVNTAHLRVLIDNDGNFSNGGTQCYYNGDGTGVVISYNNPIITVTGLTNNHIPDNSTRYITLASIHALTPLPVDLYDFNAELNANRVVDLEWNTASEINTLRFELEKSKDAQEWKWLSDHPAAGNSSELLHYIAKDLTPNAGINYYRLKIIDTDGSYFYSDIHSVFTDVPEQLLVYPNPTNQLVIISGQFVTAENLRMTNALGQEILLNCISQSKGSITLNVEQLSPGIYYISWRDQQENEPLKRMVLKR